MTLTLPTIGQNAGTWGDLINAALIDLDGRAGAGEIVSTVITSGVATTAGTTGSTAVPGSAVIVPVTSVPVWLQWGGTVQQPAAGTGLASLQLFEGSTLRSLAFAPLRGPAGQLVDLQKRWRLGPVSGASRTFSLVLATIADSGQTPTLSLYNSALYPTYLAAVR